ncbi:hypothetical protein DSO57_1029583 [Entomophthora muscae]|uniref:Uncharacterized protein n=1 Tax=Entomophthora muscae TaxID=34485 RepID=A0ACC2S3A0_9FUNG|nr:hypothetical protein DSO57_1029583 [Entomophthora muscae]
MFVPVSLSRALDQELVPASVPPSLSKPTSATTGELLLVTAISSYDYKQTLLLEKGSPESYLVCDNQPLLLCSLTSMCVTVSGTLVILIDLKS